jgi:hypothetical protein
MQRICAKDESCGKRLDTCSSSTADYVCPLGFARILNEDLQMNTVLSEIKKWNTKYLRKLETRTNSLAVNLLDNSETIHRLKRYTVVILPDRRE